MSSDRERLAEILRGIEAPIAIAVSGGIDSLTLATLAHTDGTSVEMFHAVSPAVPGEATARVERLAAERGWRLRIVDAGEFDDPAYRANPVNRCYFCKTNLYGTLARATRAQILSGANRDDLGDYRPGLDAAREHAVRHPFVEAGIGKPSIRALAREAGLGDLAELPAAPCLSSRVETGIPIRADILLGLHAIERALATDFPLATVRCRIRAEGIVVELDPETLAAVDAHRRAALAEEAQTRFADLLPSATLRFAPYRRGSAFLHGVA